MIRQLQRGYLVYTVNEIKRTTSIIRYGDGTPGGKRWDINTLNETSHYAEAADFEKPRLLLPRRVSHTLPPPDAIVLYLTHTFHLPWGEVTITLQDVAYHLGLRAHGNPVGGCLRDFGRWYDMETWAMVEQLLGDRPPVAAHQAVQRKESFTLKLVWLHVRVRQMPPTDDPETLRHYVRCYIMLLIGGYLLTEKSNNLVHVLWLPLLRDFAEYRVLSWSSAVLAWTYQSLCLAAQQGVTNRGVYQYPLAARLVRLQQQSTDQHQASVMYWRVSIDRLWFDEFAWRVYDDPVLQALCPHWFHEEEEWGTWLSAVPLVCFNIVRFHHVDWVKRQFNGEQSVPGIPVNLDRYLTTTGRGEDVWWPERLQQWYDGWRQKFEPDRSITVHHMFDTRPTSEYYDWWCVACRVRHLSGQEVLEDPKLVELPPDVQPTASQPRDDRTLPRGMPDRRRRARE
ncbi:uncharacterized protein DS421_12g368970 [Arachis hypogaea]|nr:uncharacterized protein DS421_12g368970 [Arachis hypogaea]